MEKYFITLQIEYFDFYLVPSLQIISIFFLFSFFLRELRIRIPSRHLDTDSSRNRCWSLIAIFTLFQWMNLDNFRSHLEVGSNVLQNTMKDTDQLKQRPGSGSPLTLQHWFLNAFSPIFYPKVFPSMKYGARRNSLQIFLSKSLNLFYIVKVSQNIYFTLHSNIKNTTTKMFRYSTPILAFNALSKWHDLQIRHSSIENVNTICLYVKWRLTVK